jgi:hypothetical protein
MLHVAFSFFQFAITSQATRKNSQEKASHAYHSMDANFSFHAQLRLFVIKVDLVFLTTLIIALTYNESLRNLWL